MPIAVAFGGIRAIAEAFEEFPKYPKTNISSHLSIVESMREIQRNTIGDYTVTNKMDLSDLLKNCVTQLRKAGTNWVEPPQKINGEWLDVVKGRFE
jgi:hypothetical protein